MSFPKVEWRSMDEAYVRAADTSDWIAVLPLGATEQHGPHLPAETDTIIAEAVSDQLCASGVDELDVRILPAEAVGYSPEHLDHPETKSLSYDEAISRWVDIGEQVANAGVRRFVLLNAHGGNSPLMTIVAQELRVRLSMLAVATSWTRFIKDLKEISVEEHAFGIHGGDIETSVILALMPDAVDMSKANDFPNLQERLALDYKHLRAYGPHAFGWKAADLNPLGVTGNAGAASPAKGNLLLKSATNGVLELLREVADFDIDTYFRDRS